MKAEKTVVVDHMDREGMDKAMADLAAHQREINRIEAELNEEIDRLKAEAEGLAREHLAGIKIAEAKLEAAAAAGRKDIFGDSKTLKLTHGEIGFRSATALVLASKSTNWAKVLDALIDGWRLDAVRVTREVNKDVLKTWPAAALAAFEVKLRTSEKFFAKPDVEKIQ